VIFSYPRTFDNGGESGVPIDAGILHVQLAAPEGFSACFPAPACTMPGVAASLGKLTRFHHRF
jgi:hypothetical protein